MTEQLRSAEYRILCQAVSEAVGLATAGNVTGGYDCLRAGLDHARELVMLGEPWATELADEYEQALRHYNELMNGTRARTLAPRQAAPAGRALRLRISGRSMQTEQERYRNARLN